MVLIQCRGCKRLICGIDASGLDDGGPVEIVKEHLTKLCCIASYDLAIKVFVKGLAEVQGAQLHIVERDE